ncbi:hypothetical protein [Caulobacter sp. Root1455]|uniref:hypothetical protein n=1 Tax=Caulobacter sp. Root1455 TaxID=1736465 RepID=UPI0012E39ED8|nr:hypothetical protein [Caulobacter sp. Root1455]
MLLFGIPYEQIVQGINSAVKRKEVSKNFLDILPLIREHFLDVSPSFIQSVDRRYYPAGRGLMVPFDVPIIYGDGARIVLPWMTFWKRNPLSGEALSLFVTLVDEVIFQDPDLEDARFEIIDFSAPRKSEQRQVVVTNSAEIPRLTDARKSEMLAIFAEGYFLAKATLAESGQDRANEAPSKPRDPDQPDFFDDPSAGQG